MTKYVICCALWEKMSVPDNTNMGSCIFVKIDLNIQWSPYTANKHNTAIQEYLAAIIFGGFSDMTIWQIINLAISNTGISKNCDIVIWRRLILANFLDSPISPNKSSPIINHFTVHVWSRYQFIIYYRKAGNRTNVIFICTKKWSLNAKMNFHKNA